MPASLIVLGAVGRVARSPVLADYATDVSHRRRHRPAAATCRQEHRRIDWRDEPTTSVLASRSDYRLRLAAKARQLGAATTDQPLHAYRQAELAIMSRNFSDPREPYPRLRRAFVHKRQPTRTPPHLARPLPTPAVCVPGGHAARQ